MSLSEWDSTILQFYNCSSAFLEFISATVTYRSTILQSHVSNKIMGAHVVDKNGMRAVDEKQVISL